MIAADDNTSVRRLLDEHVEIAVVDYGMGNRRSVEKAFEHIGASVSLTSDHEQLRAAAGLVVPGVGAFPRGMANLRELGLDELLRERLAAGTPVLGICLGMQLAFERSTEQGGAQGLGLIGGEVRPLEHGALKLPHIGWSEVSFLASSPLTEGLPRRCAFYHVHSFAPAPSARDDVLGTAVYGAPFASVVAHAGFYGVQFHPEKSSAAGLRLLANFARICARAAMPVGSPS
ncbi:MAG TPA: imidazole glycerol phosphate synthase subunit HisH [Solirubrobacteraceae bacterium]|nr:imidazole glycerol phosphate synthase subunit HisH [Solirubrobacteraceae bacterium]